MTDLRYRKGVDWPLLACSYLLAAIGVIAIFGATRGEPGSFARKQLVNLVLGTIGLTVVAAVDFHRYARASRSIYAGAVALLALVFLPWFHRSVNGAGRWIRIGAFLLQPSEFAKILMVVTVAAFITVNVDEIQSPTTVLRSFGYIVLPLALVYLQPDLGTALVLLAIWVAMMFLGGARYRHLGGLLAAGLLIAGALLASGHVKSYQIHRLQVFLNPSSDTTGTGYHVHQAALAIGSGGMWGKGYLHGTQVQGGYIPERQTDFIFTEIGEEFGFVGTTVLIVLYGLLLWRGAQLVIIAHADLFGRLVAGGVVAMLAVHVIVNIGMNIGILPVAGVPLVLVSYGGSSALVTLTAIGLLQSVARYRHELVF